MEHAKARLQQAVACKDWTAEDFQWVIYSEECSVEQQPAGQQRWVFSTPGEERWHVDCVNPVKHRQVKLIVWGCFWGKQCGPPVPFKTGSINAHAYRDLLCHWLLPVLKDVRAALGNPVFPQDNAKIHTAKLMLSFFECYTVPLKSHPAYSSDLNPIELVWTLLKRQLRVDYPDLINYPGGPDEVKAKLAEVLPLSGRKSHPSSSRRSGGRILCGCRQSSMRRDGTHTTSYCAESFLSISSTPFSVSL